jgi:hypothetical protein
MHQSSHTSVDPRLNRRMLMGRLGGGALSLAGVGLDRFRAGTIAHQAATPVATDAEAAFDALLRLVPDPYPAATGGFSPLFYYADIAGQLASVGLSAPTDSESHEAFVWGRVMHGMTLPAEVSVFRGAFDWEETRSISRSGWVSRRRWSRSCGVGSTRPRSRRRC